MAQKEAFYEKVKLERCPHCGSRNLGVGSQNGYAAITPEGGFFKSANVYHIICSDCGAICYSCVNKPELFAPKDRD